MENTNSKELQELMKNAEGVFSEYAKALSDGLENENINIDDIESMLISAIARIKQGFLSYTQDKIAEEDKKKLKPSIVKNAERK